MRKMSNVVASALVVTSILGYSLPVLADDNTQTTPPTGQVQNGQSGTTAPASPADKATTRKEKIQNEILRIQKAEQYQQNLVPIRQLQAQEKQLRDQIKSLRDSIHAQVKSDRQAKNYTALIAALNDMIPMQDDIASAEQAAQTAKADWDQLKTDNKANNADGIKADLEKLQTDIQARISVSQKILADLQKINGDLGTPAATAPSTTATNS